jgi:hypothetical protein
MHITGTHRRCSDGTCPAVHDIDDPALIAVRGSALRASEARADLGDIPAHEEVVVLAWSLLESYARERR